MTCRMMMRDDRAVLDVMERFSEIDSQLDAECAREPAAEMTDEGRDLYRIGLEIWFELNSWNASARRIRASGFAARGQRRNPSLRAWPAESGRLAGQYR